MTKPDSAVTAQEVADAIAKIGGSVYMFPLDDKLVTECSRDELLVVVAQLIGEREYMQASVDRWRKFSEMLRTRGRP